MADIDQLLQRNRTWAQGKEAQDAEYFERHAHSQAPAYLWIGCADSRVSAALSTGLEPGEIFVHRNVANQAVESDENAMAVLQYAVQVLKVEHIIVCGHYGCGGVQAACGHDLRGPLAGWIAHVEEVYGAHREELEALALGGERERRLCELNALAQVQRLRQNPIVRAAWDAGQRFQIHPWIYDLASGRLKALAEGCSGPA